jgi:putative addiction module antidote
MVELKLCKIGDSVGVILPEEVLAHLNVAEGDTLFATEGDDGAVNLVSEKAEFDRKLAIFADLSQRYKNALRELAQ